MATLTQPIKIHGGRAADLIDLIVGRLTVVRRVKNNAQQKTRWLCKCVCGNETVVDGCELRKAINGAVSKKTGFRTGTRSCGCLHAESVPRGSKHPHFGKRSKFWKGGKTKTTKGYTLIWNPKHPNAYASGYVYEHIALMADSIGRALLPREFVHHKNGNRSDNRIENLELWSKSHPPGQRVADKVSWTKEILALYDPAALGGFQ